MFSVEQNSVYKHRILQAETVQRVHVCKQQPMLMLIALKTAGKHLMCELVLFFILNSNQ